MLKEVPILRLTLLFVAVLAFGALSWINGGPVGNVGARLAVVLAIGGSALAGRGCVLRRLNRERS